LKKKKTFAVAILTILAQCLYTTANPNQNHAGAPTMNIVTYEDFGAKGDGKTDDIAAIAKAHAYANLHELTVKANDNATYYIGGQDNTVVIQTDTDFGDAKFIINDTDVKNHRASIFKVLSKSQPIKPKGIKFLKKNQRNIDAPLPQDCVVCVTNANIKHYIRRGLNQNKGDSQKDLFIVRKNGEIDENTPILWDFEQITDIIAYPIDTTPLTIRGGHFTTIANTAESKYTYYARGIAINRSNVLIQGLTHRITNEGNHGAPYNGFILISNCTNTTVRDTTLNGHKTYQTIGSVGKPVSMGSYDISVGNALNISFLNCNQFDDIKAPTHWGIMGSNYCKNLLYEQCKLSRFDAHQGVYNATIRNSILGRSGINAIGSGKLIIENTTVYGNSFINLRSDYGSTWHGEVLIKNCIFIPACGRRVQSSLINGFNDGQHNFGYPCAMPSRITIEQLHIDDSNHPKNYHGPALFADFNPRFTDASYVEKYPYTKTREVILSGISTASGKPLRISKNPVMFQHVILTHKGKLEEKKAIRK